MAKSPTEELDARLDSLENRLGGGDAARARRPRRKPVESHGTETAVRLAFEDDTFPTERLEIVALAVLQDRLLRGDVPMAAELDQFGDRMLATLDFRFHPIVAMRVPQELALAHQSWLQARLAGFLARLDRPARKHRRALTLAAGLMDLPLARVAGDVESDATRAVVSAHPTAARAWLESLKYFDLPVVEAVGQHHERLDGGGYPQRLSGDALGSFGRLLAVVAAYVGQLRPWESAIQPAAAMRHTLAEMEGGRLDLEWLTRLLEVSFHPPGTLVELSTGERAVVVAAHRADLDTSWAALPVVRLLRDGQGRPVAPAIYWNLAQMEGRTIARAVADGEAAEAA